MAVLAAVRQAFPDIFVTETHPKDLRGSPAIHIRFSRLRGTVQQGPVQRQETQIVQPCKTLDDFLL